MSDTVSNPLSNTPSNVVSNAVLNATADAAGAARPTLTPETARRAGAEAHSGWMLPLLLIGQALAAMDTAIVNVAGPALKLDLGVTGALLQLIIAGYGLAYATLLITGARLGDHFGYRRVFMIGVALFSASSLICGSAQVVEALVIGRILQGVGAALLVPQVLSIIQTSYEGPAKARAIGLYSMILGLGAASGQFLGGLIVSTDLWGFGWRPAFLINVPIGIALLALAPGSIPAFGQMRSRKFDIAGVVMIAAVALSILVPLTFGREMGWPWWSFVLLGCGTAGVAVFWQYEVRRAARGGGPLVDPAAVLATGIRPGLLVILIGFFGYGGWLFCVALYLQSGLGHTAFASGLVFTAYALGFGVSNLTWSRLPPALLSYAPAAALAVLALSSAAIAAIVATVQWSFVLIPLLFLAGCGHGLSFGASVSRMTNAISSPLIASLSGLVTSSSQFAIVSGTAVLGSVYLAISSPQPTPALAADALTMVASVIAAAAAVAVGCAMRLPRLKIPGTRRAGA